MNDKRRATRARSVPGTRRRRWAVCLALLSTMAIVVAAAPTIAQDNYPNRPVKIIAPQAPGGGVDLVARLIADRLRVAMGQSFVVENQAGAGGAIAAAVLVFFGAALKAAAALGRK